MGRSIFSRTRDLLSGGKSNDQNETISPPHSPATPATSATNANDEDIEPIIIIGAGIVGLVLALALDKHCGIKVDLYEQAAAFHDDVGAGMGCYPNGLRVIEDISPDLLADIQDIGYPYLLRRYERHDGTEVASADERKLMRSAGQEQLDDLQPIGLRRWRLQKILYQAVQDANIQVHFQKRLESLENLPDTSIKIRFADGTERRTRLLIGVDGSKSQVRNLVCPGKYELKFTGTTCLMGTADVGRPERGLCLPSSNTTKCHGAFYPTGEHEQCFQFHFPTDTHQQDLDTTRVDPKSFSWGGLTHTVEQEECSRLADQLQADGWDEKYIQPLRHVTKALKIGFSTLDPPMESFVFGRTVLVSDACHPPTPYLGQGAQMGLEDAGTLALLLKKFCVKPTAQLEPSLAGTSSPVNRNFSFDLKDVEKALALYDKLRRPRTAEILGRSQLWGQQQQKRATSPGYNKMKEETIKREIFYHETLPILLPAVRHDYAEDVHKAILELEAGEAILGGPVSRPERSLMMTSVPEEADALDPTMG